MYKVALFASHKPGIEITKFLKKQKSLEISMLYLSGKDSISDKKIANLSGLNKKRIFYSRKSYETNKHINFFKKNDIDCLITVFWPWIIKKDIYGLAKKTINFHPSLLPYYKGWYPHVHNLIENTQSGVTLHELEETADSGKIWVQKKVNSESTDDAKDLYKRLQIEIVNLFKKNWKKIKNDEIKPFEQKKLLGSFKKKKEVNSYDCIDLNKKILTKELIDILRARSFGNKSFAYFYEGKKKIYLNLTLSN
ncbi:formyltransferase family protein [Alphaproteobacteria bacterium]|nr:formyltransferase family protein [Alphaproteobacteria bacterium]